MKREIELLAPGGNVDSIKSAILAGANAIYCGLNKFNARNRAANISFDELQGILRLAHKNNCKVFLTLNIIILDSEIPALIKLLNRIVNTSIDGLIVQDLGLFYLLNKHFKSLKIHASTQLTTHNHGQIQFLSQLNAERVNLSRELNIHEIKALTIDAHKLNVLTEVFVHGSYCISFSGICYMSSVHGGNSGNRGRCSQPCRDKYEKTTADKIYPLNLKDNSAFFDLPELYNAGVDSLKIEGRIKEFDYVFTVVKSWKKQMHHYKSQGNLLTNNSDLYKVFNRDFSNGFLIGNISNDMFIDDPRSFSSKRLSVVDDNALNNKSLKSLGELYQEKENVKAFLKKEIDRFDIGKLPLKLSISGTSGLPLRVLIETPDAIFEVFSELNLVDVGNEALDEAMILKRLKAINDTEYFIKQMELNIKGVLYLPFKELSAIKNQILYILNGSVKPIAPVILPVLHKQQQTNTPTLSVLISSQSDIELCKHASVETFFQLPNSFNKQKTEYLELFKKNEHLIPWFPSVLIGNDYADAVVFLNELQPPKIVSNNTGIAFEAYKNGIAWIAGANLNIANSYSMACLSEEFNCAGAFLSNEISKEQRKSIKLPNNFKLYSSIYHPIELMTSRQCLFHQVSGCNKNIMDNNCLLQCEKQTTITNLKNKTFIIHKAKGSYHTVYNAENLLNTDLVKHQPGLYASLLIDLRNIKTETKTDLDTASVIELFKSHLRGDDIYAEHLNQHIYPTINLSYEQGI